MNIGTFSKDSIKGSAVKKINLELEKGIKYSSDKTVANDNEDVIDFDMFNNDSNNADIIKAVFGYDNGAVLHVKDRNTNTIYDKSGAKAVFVDEGNFTVGKFNKNINASKETVDDFFNKMGAK